MPLLNAFVDSVVCVGFSSENGLKLDSESQPNGDLSTSKVRSSVLAIITSDCATYPSGRNDGSSDSSYPPVNCTSTRGSFTSSFNSGRSTPITSLATGLRIPKQHILLAEYDDLPHYCFPDGVQITYERTGEKVHYFVIKTNDTQSYAVVLTFQQGFTLQSNEPDDGGIYQINDFKLSSANSRRTGASKIPVAIEKKKIVSSSTTASPTSSSSSPETEKRSRKIPSAYPKVDSNSTNRGRSTSSHEKDKQSQQPNRHYEVQTASSFQKNLSPKAVPPPTRAPRQRSQDSVALSSKIPTSSSSGMRNRADSNIPRPSPVTPSSTAKSSSPTTTSAAAPSEPAKVLYLPHCIVLMSSEPYWTAMKETISIIHDEITRSNIEPYSKEYKKLIQKYAFLVCNTPIPPVPWERYLLSFNVACDRRFVITFDPPMNADRSILDLDLSVLILTINIGKLLNVLSAILTELPIIFFSSNYSTLVTTLECIHYLIYPLKWNNIYVPLVPDGLRDVYLNDSPGVYIKGAHPRHQAAMEKLNICLTCNLDNDKNVYVPNNMKLHDLPPTRTNRFVDSITRLLEEIKKDRALKDVPAGAARLPMEEQRKLDRELLFNTNQKVSKLFLDLMIDLYGDALEPNYWKVNPQQTNAANPLTKMKNDERRGAVSMFDKERYLRPKTEGIDLEFYQAFVDTVAFQYVLKEEMTSTSLTGFKNLCEKISSSREHNLYLLHPTPSDDIGNNLLEPTSELDDPSSLQLMLTLPEWPLDLSSHYLDSCIDSFTEELEDAQEERSPAAIAVYSYLRGCARVARGEYLEGLRDLYSIENPKLFPQQYIETVIVPRLTEEHLIDLFLNEPYYRNSAEWKKVRIHSAFDSMSSIDLDDSGKLARTAPIPQTPNSSSRDEFEIVDDFLTYKQFSDHVHRLNIVLDQDTTEALFKALSYWIDNRSKTLKNDSTLPNKSGQGPTTFTFQHTPDTYKNHARKNSGATPLLTPTPPAAATPKPSTQLDISLPTILFESFVDIWHQIKAEKVRIAYHLPEDRQKHESILKISLPGIVSKKDGPGQIVLTQKRLYFLPETRSDIRFLTELINITSVAKYQHQTHFLSSTPGIKIQTTSLSSTSSLPRDNKVTLKSQASSLERDMKSSSISFFFKTNHEQELWYVMIVELWSGLVIAHEQCDTAVLNKASRHIALMDTIANIDYNENTATMTDKAKKSSRQKSLQHQREECLEMAFRELSLFTQIRKNGTMKPISPATRKILTRRLSPSINEIERKAVRCLVVTEHPETGQSSLWCAYGSKLKVYNINTWMCDTNDLYFPSLITAMCLDARYKLWVRCLEGQLFIVDTLTRICEGKLDTNDGQNGCQSIVFDPIHNHILTANQMGFVTLWNASSWERVYQINLLEIYKKAHNIQDKTYVSQATVTLQPNKPSNHKTSFPNNAMGTTDFIQSYAPAQVNPTSNDKLEHIQIYDDLLFACYRDDYILVLRFSDSDIYAYEHLISAKYKTGNAIPIDTFLVYNKQLWVSTGCILSIFDVSDTLDENAYNLIMKKPVDDDNIVTMLGFSGHIWAGSLNGSIYVFRMDNYELYKTYTGHRDRVYCLCPMLNTYVASGSAERDTSIAIWESAQGSNSRSLGRKS